ncbi:hypothetical protein TPA0907_24480 [Micromonospora humidisoli]|nr:hypothetical protein TPA0907_24480 [Micromonospora sp. AKA109]
MKGMFPPMIWVSVSQAHLLARTSGVLLDPRARADLSSFESIRGFGPAPPLVARRGTVEG